MITISEEYQDSGDMPSDWKVYNIAQLYTYRINSFLSMSSYYSNLGYLFEYRKALFLLMIEVTGVTGDSAKEDIQELNDKKKKLLIFIEDLINNRSFDNYTCDINTDKEKESYLQQKNLDKTIELREMIEDLDISIRKVLLKHNLIFSKEKTRFGIRGRLKDDGSDNTE